MPISLRFSERIVKLRRSGWSDVPPYWAKFFVSLNLAILPDSRLVFIVFAYCLVMVWGVYGDSYFGHLCMRESSVVSAAEDGWCFPDAMYTRTRAKAARSAVKRSIMGGI